MVEIGRPSTTIPQERGTNRVLGNRVAGRDEDEASRQIDYQWGGIITNWKIVVPKSG
nr:hypothetical protein [Candidatus Njordarchaeota archaeon]